MRRRKRPSFGEEHDLAEETKLMYVGLTRPVEYLFLTCSRTSDFITQIEGTGKVLSG